MQSHVTPHAGQATVPKKKKMIATKHTLTAFPSIPLSEEKLTQKCFCGMDSFELPKESEELYS